MFVTLLLCLLVSSPAGLSHATPSPLQEPPGSGKGGSLPVASSAEQGNRSAGFFPSISDADEAIASPQQDMMRGPKPAYSKHYGQRCYVRPASICRCTGDVSPAARRSPGFPDVQTTAPPFADIKMETSPYKEDSQGKSPEESLKNMAIGHGSNDNHEKLESLISKSDDTPIGFWHQPAVITENHFKYKSLSSWSLNIAVGCSHGCRFCYVPSTSTNKLKPHLANYGVADPDLEWGQYVLLRPWDEKKFIRSLNKAENTPSTELNPDGNRAVLLCSTTDPYQVMPHPDAKVRKQLMKDASTLLSRALELILHESTLNVRILTRGPLAKRDFDLFGQFGDRLLFGMSLPTLDNRLAKIYEPGAPSPSQRLKTLQEAKAAGIPVFVAVAPTYPECDESDLEATLRAVKALDPVTIFHEPINIRAENVKRIAQHAASLGVALKSEVFDTPRAWRSYALSALRSVESIAMDLGIADRLHLWPDSTLGSMAAFKEVEYPTAHAEWLERCWSRVSEWPGNP